MSYRALLLDIEGTTSSISFVKDVLFPYASERVFEFLQQSLPKLRTDTRYRALLKALIESSEIPDKKTYLAQLDEICQELIEGQGTDYLDCQEMCGRVAAQCKEWIQNDKKVTPLKQLQGLIWEQAYADDSIKGHVYPDVRGAMEKIHSRSIPIYIFSSGSIQAQQLLFQHSVDGDLTVHITGYFDTNTGPKSESDSYREISKLIDVPAEEVLFLTDVETEASAAAKAGLQVRIVLREGNSPVSDMVKKQFHAISSLDEVV